MAYRLGGKAPLDEKQKPIKFIECKFHKSVVPGVGHWTSVGLRDAALAFLLEPNSRLPVT